MSIPITYGVPTDRCGLQLALGREHGFFRDEGLSFSLEVVFGGPEIAARFSSGALRVGELGTPPGLTAMSHGARFKIVGSGVRRGAVQYLVARPEVAGWDGLRGRSLGALSRGSCSDFFLREVVRHHGLDPDHDVRIVGLGERYPQVLSLIESGDLSGAILSEPHVSVGEARGLFRVWLGLNTVAFVPRMQWTIAVAHDDTLRNDPELIRAVLRGCRRSYRYANDNPDEWTAFGAHHYGISRGVMAKAIARERPDLHFDCEVDEEGLEAAIALQSRIGSLHRPLTADEIVDRRFADAAAIAPSQTLSQT